MGKSPPPPPAFLHQQSKPSPQSNPRHSLLSSSIEGNHYSSCTTKNYPNGRSGLSRVVSEEGQNWEQLPQVTVQALDCNGAPNQRLISTDHHKSNQSRQGLDKSTNSAITDNSTAVLPVVHVRSPSVATPSAGQSYFSSKETLTQPISVPPHPLRPTLSSMSVNSQYSASPGSAISSPALAAMTDITPLPSPIMGEDSTVLWKRGHGRLGSSGSLSSLKENAQVEDFSIKQQPSDTSRASSVKKKKAYSTLMPNAVEAGGTKSQSRSSEAGHSRHRSLSEYAAEPIHNVRPRNTTISLATTANGKFAELNLENPLHREKYLAEQRGFAHGHESHAVASFPTPPPSNRSVTGSEGDEMVRDDELSNQTGIIKVRDRISGQTLRYREVRPLGQGTFSKVILGTKQALPTSFNLDESAEPYLDWKQLAAIKIVEHGPAGGADEERMELSLKREIEIMRSISHPSLIHLMAYGMNEDDSLLILRYCPGGDLFDLASEGHELLTPALVQRIFAELVDACRYLHDKNIVHRDIKLENVLVNIRKNEISTISKPSTYERPIVTLTDLGLSRHVDPENPMLTTRCGSEDYAAPEILLSQSYDGRHTDAWALGVVLYALMEGRLPFDPPPPKPGSKIRSRGRAAHRIARCEWIWSRFGDAYGEWDDEAGKGWEGPRDIVHGLLKKVNKGRMTLDEMAEDKWVKGGIQVQGGIKIPQYEDEA